MTSVQLRRKGRKKAQQTKEKEGLYSPSFQLKLIIMLIIIICAALFITMIAAVTWEICQILQKSKKLHLELDLLLKDSIAAKTREEIEILWESMKITSKKCDQQPFTTKINAISQILLIKNSELSK